MLKNFGKGLTGLLSTREEKQTKGEKVKKNGTHPKMNGAKHDYYDGRSSGSYKRYQPAREMEPSSRGHRDRRREGGNHPRQHPSREYDRSRRYYSDEQPYRVNQEYVHDRDRQQYQPSGYYDPSPRYHQDQHGYPLDPYAPPKPPRGHQSKNRIYLPEDNENSMVKRKNLQNRYEDYSGKPPRVPYNRNPSRSRDPPRGESQQRYNAVSNRPSQSQHAPPPQRQTSQQTPSQYRSFGSEPESEVRNDRHAGGSYNSYNKREPQQLFYPQSASLDRRSDKKRHMNYDYEGYERMHRDDYSGYQSDRIVDERGYDYQIPEWLTASDPSARESTSVTYKPRSGFPKPNYRSDGEYDISENSDTEYKRWGSDVGGSHADHHTGERELAGRMTPENYGRPSDSATKEYSSNYRPLRQYSGRVDYGHYSSDGEVLSEPERDPPPVPASAHYYSQPLHDDRRGYIQPQVHDGGNYQRSQLKYDSDPSDLRYSSDAIPSVKRRPMVEMEPAEDDEPPPLRTVREIKAYNQHVKKIRKSSSENVLQRSTVTATYQPSPQSADPNLQNYKQPVSAFSHQPQSRGRSRSQERPFPAREFVRSQSPLSEPEVASTSLRQIRSRNNSAVFCIVSQTSPAVSSDQGSDTDPTPQKLAPSGLQRVPPAKVTSKEHELLRSSSQESYSSSDASPKRYTNGTSSQTVRSDTPQSLGEVVEEPVVLPSATRGDVYAIRDLTEKKQPEPKLRNFYKEEMDHQKMWNKYANEFSEPEEVSQEPVILPSRTQGDVYAIREKPKDSGPVSQPRSFYQKELEAQAEQNKHAPDTTLDVPKVVEEPLVLPSKTKGGNVYAVNDTTPQTRPGRIKPAYEGSSEGNPVKPGKNNSTPTRYGREVEKPFSSSSAKGENSMPGNAGVFVDDPGGGGVQYRPLKRRTKSLDGRDSPFRSNHSGDDTPVKESPVHQLVSAPKSHSMPRSSENVPNGTSNGNHSQKESKGEQLFKQKKKEAEFDDLRQNILAAEKLRRLKMIDAKADSEPDTAQRRRDFLFGDPPKKSTPPSIELRMYSSKNKTVEYPSHKKVFQRTDKSPLSSPKPAEYPGRDASGDPEPEPLVIEGVPKETAKQESVPSTSKEPSLQEPGKDDTALDLLQIAELKRALREYEDDIHSPRGRRKNRRERSKSDLQNMLVKALVQLEQKEKDSPNLPIASSTVRKEEESPAKAQPLSKLYRPPRSNDNLGYSSDSSQDPQHLSRAERLTGIPGVKIPALKSESTLPEVKEPTLKRDETPKEEATVVPQVDVFVQEAPLVTEELFPDEDIPLIDDDYDDYEDDEVLETAKDEVLDSGTEEEMPPKREKNLLSILKAGNRSSVDSVSTMDSMSLARPFDDIGSEYERMMSDHHEKESIGRSKSSSVDSLINMASDDEEKLTSKDAPADKPRYDAGGGKDGRRKRD